MASLLISPLFLGSSALTLAGSVLYNYIYQEEVICATLTPHSMAKLPSNKKIIVELDDNFKFESINGKEFKND